MMHLVGVSSNSASARHMSGLSNVKGKNQNGNPNVLKLNQQENGKEEDNAVTRLQSQINTLRERVQDIAKNDSLDEKTKAELTQSVKEQMNTLSQQLRQRQLELRQEELKKEEEEQQTNNPADSEEISKNTGKAKYDTFTADDGLSRIGTAMVSASNSVELSRIQQGISTRKENQISLLEKQAQKDTRHVRKSEFYHSTKLLSKEAPAEAAEVGTDSAAEVAGEATVVLTASKNEANISNAIPDHLAVSQKVADAVKKVIQESQEEDDPIEIDTLIFKKVWEVSRGEAVEAKEKEAAELKADIMGIDDDQAENLGDANRVLDESAEAEKTDEPMLKIDAETIRNIKLVYTNPLNAYRNAQLAAEKEASDSANVLDDYA